MDNQNKYARILLNCMPPAQILMPSITLNILKSVLKQNGDNAEIIYWNLKLEPFFNDWAGCFDEENNDFPRLLPFIYFKAKQYNDESAKENVRNLLVNSTKESSQIKKRKRSRAYLLNLPEKTISRIDSYIKNEIAKFDFTDVLLSGFTAKFYQWLPALFLAEETKKAHSGIKTVIGGFDSKSSAVEILRNFNCFDFAVWGEGEYPLVQLSNTIKSGSSDFSIIPGLVYREKNQIIVSEKKQRQYLNLDLYPEPDFDDFYSTARENKEKGQFFCYPLEAIRGCFWNKCKFCVLNKGYKYRERNGDSVLKEIEIAVNKYQMGSFQFMDNSIIGIDRKRLDSMLDKLTAYSLECKYDFSLAAEIVPYKLDAAFYKKLALAGFRMAQIGGESFADSLSKKNE